ncbi:oligosaccharide flippase family protein (plasmid) [Pseudohalocynthiibacter aestuariivivens]|uniref:Oligosaccharide flippase family protein n=1 Tax=Roseovarius pelagicus TaxID=2980108 RepID=A0ABY6DC52_9RHOB|nr:MULTISPECIES: oligosaccharide flippase family protein [Rhodobacterales]QIE47827.1 oligosaccharide flippase family protein [Pseudohalocynthiibacter aestuariivivens]UXX81425.1 oligosaccharide flippase family protein [Roseovarius pelagicus]
MHNEAPARSASGAAVRALTIIGSASALRILIGILRLKIIAALLGPTGVGLFGLFTNLQGSIASVAGLGLNFGGVRQLALAKDDPARLTSARQALFIGNLLLGLIAVPVIFFAREWLAELTFQDSGRAWECGLIGIGAMLTMMAGSQAAVLQALGFIKPLAWLSVIEITLATVIGTVILLEWRIGGVIALVLLTPALNFLIGLVLVARNAGTDMVPRWRALPQQWREAVSVSVAHMAGTSVALLTLTFVLAVTGYYRGTADVGRLQAVLSISGLSTSFLIAAMQTDYYPRLMNCASNVAETNALVNAQARLGLLVSGPLLIGLAGTAEWILPLLFSAEFTPAAPLMGWWLLSDVLLVPAWVVGFLMVAHQDSKAYFTTQFLANLAFAAAVSGLLGLGYGLTSLALGKIAMTAILLVLATVIARRHYGFRWSGKVATLAALMLAIIAGLRILAMLWPGAAIVPGVLAAILCGLYSLRCIARMADGGIAARLGFLGTRRKVHK